MSNTNTDAPMSLPADFKGPGNKDVVIGKGKKFYFHEGNQWLRKIVAERINEYSQAVTKADKSNLISSVVEFVRTNGRFVKLDNTGTWVYAEPLLSREKCSQTFRDYLAETYKSSNVAKRNKRRQEQQEKTNLAISNIVNKRIRTSYNSYSSAPSVNIPSFSPPSPPPPSYDMDPITIPSSPTSCATWFDWEVPLKTVDLEPIAIFQSTPSFQQEQQQQQRRLSVVTPTDFDSLFLDLAASTTDALDDDFEPLPALFGSVKPIFKDYCGTTTVDQSTTFRMGGEFQRRRTAAAFAA